jgi:formylglycine-generating enzyme required for sulfatase activity
MEMVWCWPGTFMMGSSAEEPAHQGDETRHRVTLTQGFWMARHEVTQAQWSQIMKKNPSLFRWNENNPVNGVSWDGAITFCEALSELENSHYTLPTEAQWEFACRAGTTSPFGTCTLDEGGWHIKNAFLFYHPVGKKQPNQWGFYDMHGNVGEWCLDEPRHFSDLPVSDPTGPERKGALRVFRGGGFFDCTTDCRSAYRNAFRPLHQYDLLGLRPVMVPSRPAS